MLDKLKLIGKYLLLPFSLLLGMIYYLFEENKALKEQIQDGKRDAQIQATLAAEQQAKEAADAANEDWDKIRGQYVDTDKPS